MSAFRARDLWLLPNLLSAARFPLALAFPIALLRRREKLALAILLTGAATDVLDGFFARRSHQATPLGAVIDGLADKAFGLSVVGALVVDRRLSPSSALLLSLRELLELPLAARVIVEGRSASPPIERRANAFGKIATTLELLAVVRALRRGKRHARYGRSGSPASRDAWILASALMGTFAAVSYWFREAQA